MTLVMGAGILHSWLYSWKEGWAIVPRLGKMENCFKSHLLPYLTRCLWLMLSQCPVRRMPDCRGITLNSHLLYCGHVTVRLVLMKPFCSPVTTAFCITFEQLRVEILHKIIGSCECWLWIWSHQAVSPQLCYYWSTLSTWSTEPEKVDYPMVSLKFSIHKADLAQKVLKHLNRFFQLILKNGSGIFAIFSFFTYCESFCPAENRL